MSVLTKVFVVLLTVVSIALSMLVVAAFAQQEDWRASANEWKAGALAAQAKERVVSENLALTTARELDRNQRNVSRINELEAQKADLERTISDVKRQLSEAQNRLVIEQGQVTGLSDQSKILLAEANSEREFSARLSKRNSELERQNVDLNDRVKELTASVEMARAQARALQQQLVAMTTMAAPDAGLTEGTQIPGGPNIVESNLPTVQVTPAAAAAPIRGEVTEVKGNLVSISVGNADGVAPGMKFLIYRPGGRGGRALYLGTVRVTRVDAKECAGLIEQSEGDIRQGDTARDEASFAMRG